MCVDMGAPNRVIIRVRHIIPTIEDLFKIYAMILMVRESFLNWQMAFISWSPMRTAEGLTHAGLRRFRRLNFGTNSAPEIFHEELRKLLVGIKGVRNIHDDIPVTGVDTHYSRPLQRFVWNVPATSASLTLKRSKCVFEKSELTFFGLVFTKDGIRSDPKNAIQHLSTPRNLSQLRSFLGMTNYSAQFICHGQCHSC